MNDPGHTRKIALAFFFAVSLSMPADVHAKAYEQIKLNVEGVSRDAIAYVPDTIENKKRSVVFAFHGHGGLMYSFAAKLRFEEYWPEAIVVYPQGLPCSGGVVDPEGRYPGWQMNSGELNDRDIKYFDSLVAYLNTTYSIDKIYVVGHSNGGVFAYLLWAAFGDRIAGIASIAAILPVKTVRDTIAPRPVYHVAGRNDKVVRYEWQAATIKAIKKINRCEIPGKETSPAVTIYDSPLRAPLVTYIHDGGHEIPEDSMRLIIDFFVAIDQKN